MLFECKIRFNAFAKTNEIRLNGSSDDSFFGMSIGSAEFCCVNLIELNSVYECGSGQQVGVVASTAFCHGLFYRYIRCLCYNAVASYA